MTRCWTAGYGAAMIWALLLAGKPSVAATNEPVDHSNDKLVVHEWGTFTSLEDENGKPLGGINVDDEPVPPFVHQLCNSFVLGRQYSWPPANDKGWPSRHPYVTLRLETPVMYFYPPRSQILPMTLDVSVQFRGGWLTQFYPLADADGPNPKNLGEMDHFRLTHETTSKLTWHDLHVGEEGDLPKTEERVWTVPRQVAATSVSTPSGESERYLFYRGVGNIDSPIAAEIDSKQQTLKLRARFAEVLNDGQSADIRWLWLVKIKADGAAAYRKLDPIRVTSDSDAVVAVAKSGFEGTDFSTRNIERLQAEMHAALVSEGLFADEATAMLKTWEKSYFRSGGWRLFFAVPRVWTDHYLPLTISEPASITRVMVGRTELICPEQRELLARLADCITASDASWIKTIPESVAAQRFRNGQSDFGDLGVKIPYDYRLYIELGRFRNALVLDEQSRRSTPSLQQFIAHYGLGMFRAADQQSGGVAQVPSQPPEVKP